MKKKFIVPEIKSVELTPDRDIMATSANLVNRNAVDYTKSIDDDTKAQYDLWRGCGGGWI